MGIECVTVSYGRVKGKAKQYTYYEPCVYEEYTTKKGDKVWKLKYNCGGARRSRRLAEKDALEIAAKLNIKYLNNVRQWNKI